MHRKRKSSSNHGTGSQRCEDGQSQARRQRITSPGINLAPPGHRDGEPSSTHRTPSTGSELSLKEHPAPDAPHIRSLSRRGHPTTITRPALKTCQPHEHVTRAVSTETECFSFFTFPAEIRNMIYDRAAHYPDCRSLYAVYYRRISPSEPASSSNNDQRLQDLCRRHHHQSHLRTPTILLLCRRITAECLPVLRSRPLVIDRIPPFRLRHNEDGAGPGAGAHQSDRDRAGRLMRVADFVPRATLQCLRSLEVRVGLGEGPLGSGWVWRRVLNEVLGVLSERNALARLRLLVRLCDQDNEAARPVWDREWRYFSCMMDKIEVFAHANPNMFMRREITVSVWRIDGHRASFSSEITWPRPETEEEETPKPPDRMYPDREMFPGSIMQFVGSGAPPFFHGEDE